MANKNSTLRCTFSAPGHSTTLLQGLATLRAQGQLLDVVLAINEEQFQVHKAVLASCSDYFSVFKHHRTERPHDSVVTSPTRCYVPQRERGGEERKMATSNNPRKFSEKIALHNQKQAEETAAFDEVMKDLSITRAARENWNKTRFVYLPDSTEKDTGTVKGCSARSSLQRGRLMPTATMNQTEETYSGDSYWYHEDILNVTVSNSTSVFQSPLSPLVDKAISCITIIILFITMVSLGCTMEISKIKAHILKPKGVAIAVVAQYGIMPLTAFTLAKVFQLGSIESVTVLICGCCPGGNLSNIFALALKGDMNLRIGVLSRPIPSHLTSAAAENILASACESESRNAAKRMRLDRPQDEAVSTDKQYKQEPVQVTFPVSAVSTAQEVLYINGNGTYSCHSYSGLGGGLLNLTEASSSGPTDLSMKRPLVPSSGSSSSSASRPQLNSTEINAVRQLIAGYRESAAFLLRSADELENLILQQN
ncbi:UNVERIFIED_CONTAM: hypothetical protein FKN15_074474 [Acipenser sinensis]